MSSEKNTSYDIVNTADLPIIVYSLDRVVDGYVDTIFVAVTPRVATSYINKIALDGYLFKQRYCGTIKIAYDKIVFACNLPKGMYGNTELHVPLTSIKGLVGNIICHLRRK